MQINKKEEIGRFIRFCAVGVLNTTVTFIVFTFLRALNVNIYVSNVCSYAAGVINSFIWNKKWVYRSKSGEWVKEAALFLLFFGICYAAQLVVFKAALAHFPEWLSQLIGMAVYSLFNFILNRLVTFNAKD